MSDLVERMRKEVVQDNFVGLLDEAAARIEALEAESAANSRVAFCWQQTAIDQNNRIEALEAALKRRLRMYETDIQIMQTSLNREIHRIEALEAALREIADKRKMDAVAAVSMQAIARAVLAPATEPCDQCPEPMAGPHHPECYRFIEPPAERWEVGKNGWDESDEATREDI